MVSLASTEKVLGIVAPGAGGSLKRRHTSSSPDIEPLTSSQIKKRRVTFDPEVDVRILNDENDKTKELVAEEVRTALEKYKAGEKAPYDALKSLFKELPTAFGAPLSGLLQKYVVALTNNVPQLDLSCNGLVLAVLECKWAARNDSFIRSFRVFLRALLSVQPSWASTVLQMLITMFLDAPSPLLRQHDDPPIQAARLQSRLHDCLKFILQSLPLTSSFLGTIIAKTFPFPDDKPKVHVQYIRNILAISEYCPEVRNEILTLVVERLVQTDVQMQVDMEDLDDDMEEWLISNAVVDAKHDDDADADDDLSDNESISSEESLEPEEQRIKEVRENILRLDAVMDVQFNYYSSIFDRGDRVQVDKAFENLLSQFKNTILPTYRSRHTQFLLFHFSQTTPDRTARFAQLCSSIAQQRTEKELNRVSALAYLASFIARGAHVSAPLVRTTFTQLCTQLDALRQSYEPACRGPDLRRYSIYYAITQALLYIFCFRYRDLIVTPDSQPPSDEDIVYHESDFTWHGRCQELLRRNVFGVLNPLKICAPTIVAQFARMALHLRFLYVYPLLETNKRVRLARGVVGGYLTGLTGRETALSGKRGEDKYLMDAYFPFDPYVLPKSRRWLEGDYVEWKPVPGMLVEKEEDEEESESGSEDEDEEMDAGSGEESA